MFQYPDDFFTDELIEAIYLEAEATGQEPNERHLASVRKHRAMFSASLNQIPDPGQVGAQNHDTTATASFLRRELASIDQALQDAAAVGVTSTTVA